MPKPGIVTPSGFHIFCMNSIASCGENAARPRRTGRSGLLVVAAHGSSCRGTVAGRSATFLRLLVSSLMAENGATVHARLKGIVGDANVLSADEDVASYLTDWRDRFHGAALAVVRPATTAEVAAVVVTCAELRIGIVPQGGNTGMCGGATPDATGTQVVLSLARLNRIRALDAVNATVTAEAGVPLAAVQAAAAGAGLLFPLSLASEGSCTIGGNLSTNAGGTAVLRFGNARDLTLGIEVVLADGRIWNGLRALRKDNTGYDLKQLFIGGEGTLGHRHGGNAEALSRAAHTGNRAVRRPLGRDRRRAPRASQVGTWAIA